MEKHSSHTVRLVLACTFFMLTSAGMMIVNKLALKAMPLPLTLVAIQTAFTAAALLACAPCITLHYGSRRDAWRWARSVPLLFVAMLVTSMLALHHASMGAFVVVRNLSPLISLPIESSFTGEAITWDCATFTCLLVMLLGVSAYVANDVHSNPLGFVFMIINMTLGIFERLLQRSMLAVAPIDVNKPGLMLLNNGISFVLLLPLLFASGEAARWPEVWGKASERGGRILLSCVNGIAISWSGMNCQTYVTATTFGVLGNFNKFIVVGFGIAVFREASSLLSVLGCIAALLGGFAYMRARAMSFQENRTPASVAAERLLSADVESDSDSDMLA